MSVEKAVPPEIEESKKYLESLMMTPPTPNTIQTFYIGKILFNIVTITLFLLAERREVK